MVRQRKKPIKKKKNASGRRNELRYAMASMQGWRRAMEDSHSISLSLPGRMKQWSFAGVYDGHAGSKSSEYASKNLISKIVRNVHVHIPAERNISGSGENENHEINQKEIEKGIKKGFIDCDIAMQRSKLVDDDSGTTAVCVLISPTHFYFANCGDSRAILYRGKIQFATKDHKPNTKKERKRIEKAGGFVRSRRVIGRLALSRALGDFSYKGNKAIAQCKQMVIPKPDVTIVERNNARDEFLVLACDGIYDVMTNSELTSFIKGQMALTDNLTDVCNRVLDRCLQKGSTDNLSILIIILPGCPSKADIQRKRKSNFAKIKGYTRAKRARVDGEAKQVPVPIPELGIVERSNAIRDSEQVKSGFMNTIEFSAASGDDEARQNNRRGPYVPNAFLMYYMDYWKRHRGNICEVAKKCGEKWRNRLRKSKKEKYQRRFLHAKRRLGAK